MKQMRPILFISTSLLILSFLIPIFLVLPFSQDRASVRIHSTNSDQKTKDNIDSVEVSVYRTTNKTVEHLTLEQYVIGVVSSEMPAAFHLEALKAQALAARTFVVKQLLNKDNNAPKGADITDGVDAQVFHDKKELKRIWGKDYSWKIKKVTKAVNETNGQVITYKDAPIQALFFSTSNGYTEDAENYFKNKIPYLKTVKSKWDVKSPKYKREQTFTKKEIEEKLGVTVYDAANLLQQVKWTKAHRVANVVIGNKQFTGREVREKLALRSSDFTFKYKNNKVSVTTYGYGHGVGLSQYGADSMASQGKHYKDIIKYYYTGVKIEKDTKYLAE